MAGYLETPQKPQEDQYKGKMTYEELKKDLASSRKEMKPVIERGRRIIKRYEDQRDDGDAGTKKFNIFTTNVEVLQSALYANIPKVQVSRRYGDMKDKAALLAADIIERMINTDLQREDSDFDRMMMSCVFDRLVPGGGYAWLRYVPKIETNYEQADPNDPHSELIPSEEVVDHYTDIDHVFWEDFFYGPCRSWKDTPWVGRRVYMDRDALVSRFGEEIGNKIPLDACKGQGDVGAKDNMSLSPNEPDKTPEKQAAIYEMWYKKGRCVYWISESYQGILDEVEDPLKLDGFWPTPMPLFSRVTTSRFRYIADFYILQDQYKALDELTDRLDSLTRSCKLAGAYDKNMSSLADVLNQGENQLVAVDNWAMFAEKGGMKGVIDWLPIEQISKVILELTQRADRLKQEVYELSGISDIMRGSTNPYEGVGSQQLKAQFSSVRLQKMQNEAGRFAGETLTIKAEIMLRHYPIEFLVQKSNVLETLNMQDQQDVATLQAAMQLLADEERFGWRVKIQPDSMAQVDYNQEKKDKTEFVGAASSFLNNAIPVMAQNPPIASFMMELLKFGISGYKNSQNLELQLDKALEQMEQQMNQPKGPPPEVQKMQMEMQMMQQEHQMNMQAMQMKHQTEMAKVQADMQMKQQQHAMEMRQSQEKFMMEMAQDNRRAQQENAIAMQQAHLKAITDLMIGRAKATAAEEKGKHETSTDVVERTE